MLIRTFSAAALIAASTALPVLSQDLTADTVIASVNGTDITLGHMIVLRDALPEQYKSLPPQTLFDGILEQLIQHEVLAQGFSGLDKAIELRLDNEERSLRASVALDDALDARLTDEALQALYDEKFADAAPETEYNASHILVDTEEQAADLIAQLADGADFATLAREHSIGPSGPNGGELGWFGLGMMVQPFEEAVVGMEAGQIGGPVQTQFGWHVISLNETRVKGAPSLDEVRADLMEELRALAVDEVIVGLVEGSDITRTDVSAIDPAILADTSLVQD